MSAGADDPWAALGLPRTAFLTEDTVRAAFQKAAADSHPDHAADDTERAERTAAFTRLNEAAATLTSPARRLRALRALEFPDSPAAPSAGMDETLVSLFTRIGAAVRAAADNLAQKRRAETFLAKAAASAEEFRVTGELESATEAVTAAMDALREELGALDRARAAGDSGTAGALLPGLIQRAAFLEKWRAQLRAAFASQFESF